MIPASLLANDIGAVIHPATQADPVILIEWPNGMRVSLYTGGDNTLAIVKEPDLVLDVNTF